MGKKDKKAKEGKKRTPLWAWAVTIAACVALLGLLGGYEESDEAAQRRAERQAEQEAEQAERDAEVQAMLDEWEAEQEEWEAEKAAKKAAEEAEKAAQEEAEALPALSDDADAALADLLVYSEQYHISKYFGYAYLAKQYVPDEPALYTEEAAQSAIDASGIDWAQNAVITAGEYMDGQAIPMSRQAIVDTLINLEKFTEEEAEAAMAAVDIDDDGWRERARAAADIYTASGFFDGWEDVRDQLEHDGYTEAQAMYAVLVH